MAPSIRSDCSRREWHGRCHRRPELRNVRQLNQRALQHGSSERCNMARQSAATWRLPVLPVGAVDDDPPAHHPAELTEPWCIRDGPCRARFVLTGESDMKKWFAGVLAVAGTWLACVAIIDAQTGAPPP